MFGRSSAPSRREEIVGIPPDEVDRVVSEFRAEGASEVSSELTPDGTWKVTATFPDDP